MDVAASSRAADDRERLARHAVAVAPALLGGLLVSDIDARVVVRITEAEAYGGVAEDPGSHAHRRRTCRNASMFGPVGHAYVYFTYGMHWCLNVVAHDEDTAGAVLVRAGEVVAGLDTAMQRRGAIPVRELARGPARLAAALGVTGAVDGLDLLDPASPVRLELPMATSGSGTPAAHEAVRPIRSGPRTGVPGAGACLEWRFWIDGDPTVSPYRQAPRRYARSTAGPSS